MNTEQIGNLILFQMAILGASYLPQVTTKSAIFWGWRWDDQPEALRFAWARLLGREEWHRWDWRELAPEMQAHIINQAAKLGRIAQQRLQARPDLRRDFPELTRHRPQPQGVAA